MQSKESFLINYLFFTISEFNENVEFPHVLFSGHGNGSINISYCNVDLKKTKKKEDKITLSEKFIGKG